MSAEKANNERELDRLIDRMCDQIASVDELAALGHRLADDPAARDYYIVCLELHARLAWQMTPGKPFSPEELLRYASEDRGRGLGGQRRGLAGSPASDASAGAAVELPSQIDLESQISNPPFPTLSTTRYPLPTTPFVGSWAFSCMVSAVIMGVMLLVFWAMKVNHHQHIAEAPSQSAPSEAMPEMVFVGRITGMVDVKWSDDPRFLPPLSSRAYVPLGRKYILSSGLMEITYDSGAKVILEGPCTYEVDSTAGGYLALGKLTARVKAVKGKGSRFKVQGSRPSLHPSSFILHPSSLFSVRTPTAIVTDLGTEFGVEVNDRGLTKTQVFVGKVCLASTAPNGKADEGLVLSAGQTGVVRSDNAAIVVADAAGAMRFVRAMPPPKRACSGDEYAALVLSLQPVVYYRMERPEEMEEDRLVLFDSSPGGRHGVLHWNYNYGRPWLWGRRGRFDGALYLRGPDCRDYAVTSELPDGETNQLSFSAWVRAEAGTTDLHGRIACEGDWGDPDRACRFTIGLQSQGPDGDLEAEIDQADGRRIQVREGRSTPFPMGQWQHVALVADESALRLYRNGVEVGSSPSNGVIAALDGDYLTIGCASVWRKELGARFRPSAFWGGWIDELAVFRRALRPEEIRRLFEGLVVTEKKGTGPICRNGPEGAAHKLDLSPFSPGKEGTPMNGP